MHTFEALINFHQATLNVVCSGGGDWSPGFSVSFTYSDGHSAMPYTLPRTGVAWSTSNERWCKTGLEIGITNAFDRTPTINKILANNVGNNWDGGREEWKMKCRAYRKDLDDKYRAEEEKLSPAFWFKIYNNMTIAHRECARYLEQEETNPVLQGVPVEHKASLKFLFSKVAFTRRHREYHLSPRAHPFDFAAASFAHLASLIHRFCSRVRILVVLV